MKTHFLLLLQHSFCLIVFLFCLHSCLLSHFEIIRCILKSLITTSTYFMLKYNWKKKIWNILFAVQGLGIQTSIMVSQTTWIHHCKSNQPIYSTVKFTNIYKYVLFFTCYTYDKHGNEDYWIFWIGYLKVSKIKTLVVL